MCSLLSSLQCCIAVLWMMLVYDCLPCTDVALSLMKYCELLFLPFSYPCCKIEDDFNLAGGVCHRCACINIHVSNMHTLCKEHPTLSVGQQSTLRDAPAQHAPAPAHMTSLHMRTCQEFASQNGRHVVTFIFYLILLFKQ